MAQFSILKTRVQDRLIDVNTVVSGEVGSWIIKAIEDLEKRHNFQCMEAEHAATTTEDTRKLDDRPSDWKEARGRPYLRIGQDGTTGTRFIDWAPSFEWCLEKGYQLDATTDSGTPRYIVEFQAAQGDPDIYVFPFPDGSSQWTDGDYRVVIPYYRYLTELSADADTNWFTENAEDYILNRAAATGFEVNWDAVPTGRAAQWEALAEREAQRIIRHDRRARTQRNLTLVPLLGARDRAPRR